MQESIEDGRIKELYMTKICYMHIQNITMELIIPYNQQILTKMQVNNLQL